MEQRDELQQTICQYDFGNQASVSKEILNSQSVRIRYTQSTGVARTQQQKSSKIDSERLDSSSFFTGSQQRVGMAQFFTPTHCVKLNLIESHWRALT